MPADPEPFRNAANRKSAMGPSTIFLFLIKVKIKNYDPLAKPMRKLDQRGSC
jgi:hypothetical protein